MRTANEIKKDLGLDDLEIILDSIEYYITEAIKKREKKITYAISILCNEKDFVNSVAEVLRNYNYRVEIDETRTFPILEISWC